MTVQSVGSAETVGRRSDAALLVVIVLFSVGPPTLKSISGPPMLVAVMRTTIAAPFIWLVAAREGGRLNQELLRQTFIPGVLWAGNSVTLLAAFGHTSIAIITVFQALQPAVVLVAARALLGERYTRSGATWTAIGVLGVTIVVAGGDAAVRGDGTGLALCTAALLTFSGYYLINRRLRATSDITAFEFLGGATVVAALVLIPIALLDGAASQIGTLGTGDWGLLLLIAVVLNTVAHGLLSWLHGHTTATRSSVVFLGCNVGAILIAWPVHDEPVTLLQGLGCLVTFTAVWAVLRKPAVDPVAVVEQLPAA